MSLLFVYGSLKHGNKYAYYLRAQAYVGEGVLPGYQLLCFGDYPAIIKTDIKGAQVKGEVYRVSEAALAEVDDLEGDEYERLRVQVEIADRIESALVYVASKTLLASRSYHLLRGDTWLGTDN